MDFVSSFVCKSYAAAISGKVEIKNCLPSSSERICFEYLAAILVSSAVKLLCKSTHTMFGNAVFARAKQAIAFSLFKKFFERNTTAKSKNSIIMLLPTRSAKNSLCGESRSELAG